jgi:DNA-binding NarL/FixJ family response regulator
MTIRVVVADDQPLIRDALAALVGTHPDLEIVGLAPDGETAVKLAQTLAPDVVLMDVRMPGLGGIEATKRIRLRPNGPAVVILTTFEMDAYVLAAVRAGASGFMLKDGEGDDLIAGIRSAANGEAVLAPRAARGLMQHVAGERAPDPAAAELVRSLTQRERDVLVEMAEGRTNSEISLRLHVSEATAKTHVSNILGKLNARDRTKAVVVAYASGLV